MYEIISLAPKNITEHNPLLPEGCATTLEKALAKTPAERYDTCSELIQALATVLGHSNGQKHPVAPAMQIESSPGETIKLSQNIAGFGPETQQQNTGTGHQASHQLFPSQWLPSRRLAGGLLVTGLATGSAAIFWTFNRGRRPDQTFWDSSGVNSICFGPDGKQLASGSSGMIRLWDVVSGQSIRTLSSSEYISRSEYKGSGAYNYFKSVIPPSITSVTFSPDGKQLASGAEDRPIFIWDVRTARSIRALRSGLNVNSVAFNPAGTHLACATGPHFQSGEKGGVNVVIIWNVTTGENVQTFKGHRKAVTSVAFNPNGKQVASGSGDETVMLWDIVSGGNAGTLQSNSFVTSLSFGSAEQLAAGYADGSIRLWDVPSGQTIRTFGSPKQVNAVTFSPDGKELASGGSDGTIRLWNASDGASLGSLAGNEASVNTIAYSPDGKLLVSGGADKSIRLWKLR